MAPLSVRLARPAVVSSTDDVTLLLRELVIATRDQTVAMVGELRAIRQLLENRARPRDADDLRVLTVLAACIGSVPFSAREVLRHAQVKPELSAALAAADCDTPRAIGRLLRRMERRTVDGVELVCVGSDRFGLTWCLRVSRTTAGVVR
jgi:hypothetical protein